MVSKRMAIAHTRKRKMISFANELFLGKAQTNTIMVIKAITIFLINTTLTICFFTISLPHLHYIIIIENMLGYREIEKAYDFFHKSFYHSLISFFDDVFTTRISDQEIASIDDDKEYSCGNDRW